MIMHPFFGPPRFWFDVEFVYTIIVVFLCFFIYYKTRDIYNLTKYKGIGYFRNAFLFFGLAYASRFVLHLLTFTTAIIFDVFIPRMITFPLTIVLVGYLSTIAIFYLTYSTIWKKIRYTYFIISSNIIAALMSLVAFISRSPMILSILQLVLLVFTIVISSKKHKTGKKTHIRALYILISIFWLINLFVLDQRRFLPPEIKVVFQLVSIVVFIVIYYKVRKWVK